MNLTPDQRDSYEPAGEGWSNGRFVFQPAWKRFGNYRHSDMSIQTVDPDERLAVLIRTPIDADPDRSARDLGFELDRVLSLPEVAWYAAPIDLLPPSTLILARAPGRRLGSVAPVFDLARFLGELLLSYERLHEAGLIRGEIEAGDFLIDDDGRWVDLGTDRVQVGETDDARRDDLARWAGFAIGQLGEAPRLAAEHGWIADRIASFRHG